MFNWISKLVFTGASDADEKAVSAARAEAERCKTLGNAAKQSGRMDLALDWYGKALHHDPTYAEAYNNIGIVQQELGQHDEALSNFDRALAIEPQLPEARWNRMYALLLAGDYERGLALHEDRFWTGDVANRESSAEILALFGALPVWKGEDIRGSRMLVWTEQGRGDSLMMWRYLRLVSDTHGRAADVWCEPELVRLFKAQPFVANVFSKTEPITLAPYSYHCPIMGLPHIFQSRLNSIPSQTPYLVVPAESMHKWRDRLGAIPGPKVGLVWAGNPQHAKDRLRSIPLAQLAPILDVPGVVWVSLQKTAGAQDLASVTTSALNWMADCEDYLDTAGLVANLDLVVAVDTSVAHLAGALGRPVWLLNRLESEWRWLTKREDSPWYPTLRIFRQSSPHDWSNVVSRIRMELLKWVESR